jgi:hypothetical protein
VTITRRHHPLLGQQLDVWRVNKSILVLTMHDGSRVKLPREWTDLDGPVPGCAPNGDSRFTVSGLRELIQLLERLRNRI